MAKILIGIVAVVACLVMVDSLDCNKCTVSVFGFCLGSSTPTCSTNTSVCFTSKAVFPSISSFGGFSNQGCIEAASCGSSNSTVITNGTLKVLAVDYTVTTQCCDTNKCNPVTLSGAPSSTASLSLLSVAALAAMMKSFM